MQPVGPQPPVTHTQTFQTHTQVTTAQSSDQTARPVIVAHAAAVYLANAKQGCEKKIDRRELWYQEGAPLEYVSGRCDGSAVTRST